MSSFSERRGFIKAPEALQLDGMTDELNNLLYNFCLDYQTSSSSHWHTIESELHEKLKRQLGELPLILSGFGFDQTVFRGTYNKLDWHEKYTLLEIFVDYISDEFTANDGVLIRRINRILEQENSGYRMNENYEFLPITSPEEIKTLTAAGSTGITTVDEHIQSALTLFADRQSPDYPNAIKEAICALEALAQHITNSPKGTLGQLVEGMSIHPALKETIKTLYGYTSNAGGIRHAKKPDDYIPDFTDAHFTIVTIAAIINYINRAQ